jgi:uncharacterized protein YndB with AHSA1/START domain
MNDTRQAISIAPVRKTIRVNASAARAFDVFTAGLGKWWPPNHGIGKKPIRTVAMETRLDGHWYEMSEDGTRTNVGRIIAWEPPQRFVMTWDVNSEWKPDTTIGSEVEVRFIAEGANATRVEVEHRKFEQLGAEGGAKMRRDVDGGWPKILEFYRTYFDAT